MCQLESAGVRALRFRGTIDVVYLGCLSATKRYYKALLRDHRELDGYLRGSECKFCSKKRTSNGPSSLYGRSYALLIPQGRRKPRGQVVVYSQRRACVMLGKSGALHGAALRAIRVYGPVLHGKEYSASPVAS